ncbi:MAG: PASTA domain-containing protein [Gemmatimonas sp.]|jgi:hypothetical protein|uniref:PASTA domain-containing protein n=1 Tax=Gemmatimonas sp. TaxID=1962908 RepID=UPI00391F9EE2|nr:PASTA domain-containing protein [Gemmatimonadota bacterium]
MTAAKARKAATPGRRWLGRALVAVVLGLAIGGAGGVFSVQKLEPGPGTGVDSLQVMLDSIATGRIAKTAAAPPASPEPVATEAPRVAADSAATPAEPTLVLVPAVVDLEEGTARTAILDAGLQVGEVQFQASAKPAGTVLATSPVSGARVPTLTAVSLVLSDGRPPADVVGMTDSPRRSPSFPTP